jgi:polysaccharide biosynthesis/export protein
MRETCKLMAAPGFLQALLPSLVLGLVASVAVWAQQTLPGQGDNPQQQGTTPNPGAQNGQQPIQQLPPDTIRPNYVLAPNDQITIRAPEAEEIDNRPFRIDADGNINLPLIGHIHVAGMTVQELEADLVKRLREYIREPQVFITTTQLHSAPVFFVGLFNKPGVYALQGNASLIEMLSAVGGVQPVADRHIKITRQAEYGMIPLPDAVYDPERKVSTVDINLGNLRQSLSPEENIQLQPYDQISVGRAEMVYVNGEVGKVGGQELGERESISIAQVLAQAGGFTKDAKSSKVRILRPIEGTTRRYMIEVDAKDLFKGEGIDVPLLPGDIVYVPHSYQRQFWQTFASIALPMLPYILYIVAYP